MYSNRTGRSISYAAPATLDTPAPAPIPLRELLPWTIFAGVLMTALLYLVGMDQGVVSLVPGEAIHEFVHDGRHLLGFPCH